VSEIVERVRTSFCSPSRPSESSRSERATATLGQPYNATLVTIVFHKGTEQVSFQLASIDVIGRLPAVGEIVLAQDKRATPVVTIEGPVKKIDFAYSADVVLSIVIDIQIG
jgi:hypothetical protein